MFIYYTKEGKSTSVFYNDMPFNKLHRENGPAIKWPDGKKEWWVDGKRHRLDGPAIEHSSGTKKWYVNGKRHRLSGPAIEYDNGNASWYINGGKLNTKKVEAWIKDNNINLKTKEHQVLFMLKFG